MQETCIWLTKKDKRLIDQIDMEVGDDSKPEEGKESQKVGARSTVVGQEHDSQTSEIVDEDHSETEDEQEGLQMKGIKKNQNECNVS